MAVSVRVPFRRKNLLRGMHDVISFIFVSLFLLIAQKLLTAGWLSYHNAMTVLMDL